jgi:hypothetical protein
MRGLWLLLVVVAAETLQPGAADDGEGASTNPSELVASV